MYEGGVLVRKAGGGHVTSKSQSQFVNRYASRSNGGIPCFAEERMAERAKVRTELFAVFLYCILGFSKDQRDKEIRQHVV
jgi:hypothetical protein